MFRDKLKRAASRISKKVRQEPSEKKSRGRSWQPPANFDESVVPAIVDGNGDMPTPNDNRIYGRPYLSALISSGVGPVPVDLRHPQEVASGTLPGSIFMPGRQIQDNLNNLPGKDTALALFDADGGELSNELATFLRDNGWESARMLQGGWAEWIENNEENERPEKLGSFNIGSTVSLKDGASGWVQNGAKVGKLWKYEILIDDGSLETVRKEVPKSELIT